MKRWLRFRKPVLAALALSAWAGVWAGPMAGALVASAPAPAWAQSADACRAETEPGVKPCVARIDESLENPSICHSFKNGQALGEYERCYGPMVLCGGITKNEAEAKAKADWAAGLKEAEAHGYCR